MNDREGELGVGGRLSSPPALLMVETAYSLETEEGDLYSPFMCLADLAHTVMLMETSIIPHEAGRALLQALLADIRKGADTQAFNPALGDLYTNRFHHLRQQVPEAAGWLQAGRARREVTTLAFYMILREELLHLSHSLAALMRALLNQAETHLLTIMPDYTYLQTAQPTTLAHYLLSFVQPIARDFDRLQLAYRHVNLSPAGIGSTNGSGLPLDRKRLADLLGFDGLSHHARDAMWQPDTPIEVVAMVAAALTNADRLAEDLQIWATAEFDLVELADEHTRISVIMPQKKNPYSLAFIRGIAREAIGQVASTLAHQMTPSAQVDNRIFSYNLLPRTLNQASKSVRFLAEIISAARFKVENMAVRAGQGFSGATELADFIMQTFAIDAYRAHRLVGQAVRVAAKNNQALTAALIESVAEEAGLQPLLLTDEQIQHVIDPGSVVRSRHGVGSAHPDAVRALIDQFRGVVETAESWNEASGERIEKSQQALIAQAGTLCQSI